MSRLQGIAIALSLASVFVAIGCSKKDAPDAAPTASASVAPPPPPPVDTSSSAAPAPTAPVVVAPVVHPSIDACCAALSALSTSAKSPAVKKKAVAAERVCPAIAARVKSGQVPRSEALTQIISAMTGAPIPSECH